MCRITLKRSRDENDGGAATATHSHARKKVRCIMSELPDRMRTEPLDQECPPDDTVRRLNPRAKLHSYDSLSSFFLPPTPQEIAAYDQTVLTAVRTQDFDTLRGFYAQGRPLKCSNKFGESLLHLACRKGMVEMTRFLVLEGGVPLQVCDDFGRTPLHDACWAPEPNFKLIDSILQLCPDLLYVRDRRGSTPLQYVRRSQWKHWNAYFRSKGAAFLQPRQLK